MQKFLSNLTKEQKKMLIICTVVFTILFVGILIFHLINKDDELLIRNDDNSISTSSNNNNINSNNKEESFVSEKGYIIVDIVGEVNKPGVVKLKEGSRIIDAINAAGGTTLNADTSMINLAYIIDDGVRIKIPKKGENLNETINDEVPEGIIMDGAIKESSEASSKKVNINTASVEKLMTLPGVGETVALKIIEYREEHGRFKSIEDLKKVSGIGESKYKNIYELVTLN